MVYVEMFLFDSKVPKTNQIFAFIHIFSLSIRILVVRLVLSELHLNLNQKR